MHLRGGLRWRAVASTTDLRAWIDFLAAVAAEQNRPAHLLLHGIALAHADILRAWIATHQPRLQLHECPVELRPRHAPRVRPGQKP